MEEFATCNICSLWYVVLVQLVMRSRGSLSNSGWHTTQVGMFTSESLLRNSSELEILAAVPWELLPTHQEVVIWIAAEDMDVNGERLQIITFTSICSMWSCGWHGRLSSCLFKFSGKDLCCRIPLLRFKFGAREPSTRIHPQNEFIFANILCGRSLCLGGTWESQCIPTNQGDGRYWLSIH